MPSVLALVHGHTLFRQDNETVIRPTVVPLLDELQGLRTLIASVKITLDILP